jgi:hypothetical protein
MLGLEVLTVVNMDRLRGAGVVEWWMACNLQVHVTMATYAIRGQRHVTALYIVHSTQYATEHKSIGPIYEELSADSSRTVAT